MGHRLPRGPMHRGGCVRPVGWNIPRQSQCLNLRGWEALGGGARRRPGGPQPATVGPGSDSSLPIRATVTASEISEMFKYWPR